MIQPHKFPRKPLFMEMKKGYENIEFLFKYHPKFYTIISYEPHECKTRQILLKTKSIKIAKIASLPKLPHYLQGPLLEAFKNKQRFLKVFNEAPIKILMQFPRINSLNLQTQSLLSWKVFFRLLHIKSLKITLLPAKNNLPTKIINYMKSRLYLHLQKLVGNLKSLHIYFQKSLALASFQFLAKISSLTDFLSSLSTFTIFVDDIHSDDIPDEIQTLAFQNYVTKLKLKNLSLRNLSTFFSDFKNFQKLTDLMILKITHYNADDMSFFNKLSSLQNLQTLKISIGFTNNFPFQIFLENLAIPPSTKTLLLDLQNINSNPPFNLNDHHWRNFHNLEFLKIQVSGEDTSSEWQFILNILQALKNLQTLHIINWCESKSDQLDFSQFYQSILHLKPTLKTIRIEANNISLQNFPQNIAPLSLQKLNIFATIAGDTKLKNLFNFFALEVPQAECIIHHLIINSKDSLNQLLQDLSQAPKNLQISLDMDVRSLSPKDFITKLQEKLPQLNHKNFIRLNFCDIREIEKELVANFKQGLQKCKILACVKISDSQGRILFMGKKFKEDDISSEKLSESCESSSESGQSNFFEPYIPDENESNFGSDNIGSDFSDDL